MPEFRLLKRMSDSESESRLKTGVWARLETRLRFAVSHRLSKQISGIKFDLFKSHIKTPLKCFDLVQYILICYYFGI